MSSQDVVNELKKVRIPFWAKWRGYFAARRRRKQAAKEVHYITTVYAWTIWEDRNYRSRQWYILKETGTGKRFYEYGYEHALLRNSETKHAEYARIVVPWLYGQYSNQQMREYGPKTAEIQRTK